MRPRVLRAASALLALLMVLGGWSAAAPAQRLALVVGNGAHRAVPRLANPAADAAAVAEVLRASGFRTEVLRAMQGARARVLILDACRDNPLAAGMRGLSATRSVGRGLARVETVDLGTLIAFSTSPGAVALDGTGRNSPFTPALRQHMATPGLEIRQLMTRVRRSVVEATGRQQVPWDNSSLIAEVVLRPGRPPAAAEAPPPQVALAPGAGARGGGATGHHPPALSAAGRGGGARGAPPCCS